MSTRDEDLPELTVLLPDGSVRNSARARSNAAIARELGMDETTIVENYGYSPEPPDDCAEDET